MYEEKGNDYIGPQGPTGPNISGSAEYYYPVDSTSGSAVFPSPFNLPIHNTLDSFTGPKLKELPNDLQEKLQRMKIQFIEWEINEHKKQWNQQRIMGYIIFGIVILLTLTGVSLSAYQLFASIKLDKLDTLVTEIGIEKANQIYFRSTVVGISVLIVSIVFFYLFLQFIYKTKTTSEIIHKELSKASKILPKE